MTAHFSARCLDCEGVAPFDQKSPACPHCGSFWREAVYDYRQIANLLPLRVKQRPFDLWRYQELLPHQNPTHANYLGEGGTPLLHAANLGSMLGNPNIYIKDERQNPTSSFKDRQAAVAIAMYKAAGINELVCASTGNVAIAYSAYAARAGIRLWAFLTSLVPSEKMREVAIYGSRVVKVTGTYDETKILAEQFAQIRGINLDLGSRSIACIEAMKTIAFEVCEQLGDLPHLTSPGFVSTSPRWQAPDWYFQSVSGGMGPLGVIKGFTELQQMSLTTKVPKMGVIQVAGCDPMVSAWQTGESVAKPVVSPQTLIATLATGNPGRTYTELYQRMKLQSGGEFERVTDGEAFRAMHLLAKMEGISVEPAAAVAFAGLIKLIRSGVVRSDELVVVNCTGHTMPIESHILGNTIGNQVETSISGQYVDQEEGLLAALTNIDLERYPNIVIADDEPNVRRLVKRILLSQGNYVLHEAVDGRSAVDTVTRVRPDLLILDLMMPEVDGFSVLDILQSQKETRDIPVIVITAKELTSREKERLNGRIQALMLKGDFASDGLLDEVKSVIK
jgi:threonine synthase